MTETAGGGPPKGEVLVALTFDLDPDRFARGASGRAGPEPPEWRGVSDGVPAIVEILDRLEDGGRRQATWFVRADDQIAHHYGDAGAMLDRHGDLFDELAERGDEIAWHPHLYRRNGAAWRQETDEGALRAQLARAHRAVTARGWRPRSTRIGGNYGSNGVMATLADLGLAFDSTAMPGRRRVDEAYVFDWEPTPELPYHPAVSDYRLPGRPALNLLEVPLTMVPVKAAYDKRPLRRYVDLAYRPEALTEGLVTHLERSPLLVTVTHPCCVLSGIADREHGLLAFNLAAFEANLRTLRRGCERLGRPLRFVTLAEAGRISVPREAD